MVRLKDDQVLALHTVREASEKIKRKKEQAEAELKEALSPMEIAQEQAIIEALRVGVPYRQITLATGIQHAELKVIERIRSREISSDKTIELATSKILSDYLEVERLEDGTFLVTAKEVHADAWSFPAQNHDAPVPVVYSGTILLTEDGEVLHVQDRFSPLHLQHIRTDKIRELLK